MEQWTAIEGRYIVRPEEIIAEAMACAIHRAWKDSGRLGLVGIAIAWGDVVVVHEDWRQLARFRVGVKDCRLELVPI
jgi:hypothetical protein